MKYKVGVRAMPDQTAKEFKAVRNKPRTKSFKDEFKAYEYFYEIKKAAEKSCFKAFIIKETV